MKLHRHHVQTVQRVLAMAWETRRPVEQLVAETLHAHPKWGSRDRRQFAEQVYELIRHWRWYAHLADSEAVERVWAAWYCHTQATPLPEEFAAGILSEQIEARAAEAVTLAVRESLPDWIANRLEAAYGEEWAGLAAKLNQTAEVFLRVNRLRASVAETAARLAAEEVPTELVAGAPDALRLLSRKPLQHSPTFRAGWIEIQDAGSQQIAPFLEVEPGQTVIDACAGAGGKSLHLAALMRNQGRLISCDVWPRKLAELESRARRNGALIQESQLIGPDTIKAFTAQADRVLLDVPCSGLGTLRRKPDLKWRLTEGELDRLIALQATILGEYSALVKPGGKLVYATCSLLPEENERQVERFLKLNPGVWQWEAAQSLRPDREGWDGFYMARLRRES
jgi:16S rRNA (cytosine967-C5)-methyltransferase